MIDTCFKPKSPEFWGCMEGVYKECLKDGKNSDVNEDKEKDFKK